MLLRALNLFNLNKTVYSDAKCLIVVNYCIKRSEFMVVAQK